ncbi:MAG TPA: Gfo/Idh/MocA family oxidoreductase [Victivallales bacterium]|nr:Gfo/Idh/MocA family oxidoreductase [Victivallales bacterium]
MIKKSEDKVRIGLIGYGAWTRGAYVPAIKRDGRANIISIAAPSLKTRNIAQKELGYKIETFERYEDLLGRTEVDAIMLAVPDFMHETALMFVLKTGLPVLFEPPISDKRENIISALKQLLASPQITQPDLEFRYMPIINRIADIIKKGIVGNIQNITVELESSWGPIPNYDLCNVNHLATWYVDMINNIIDAKPNRILVIDGYGTPGRRQSHNLAVLDYGNILGTFKVNITSVGELKIVIEINGSDGDIYIDILTGNFSYRNHNNPKLLKESCPAIQPYADWPGMHEGFSAFIDDVILGKQRKTIDKETTAQLHLVGLAAEASKDSGNWADIMSVDNL